MKEYCLYVYIWVVGVREFESWISSLKTLRDANWVTSHLTERVMLLTSSFSQQFTIVKLVNY